MPTLHHLTIILKQEILNIVNIAILVTQGFINENPLPEKLANATGFYCDTHNFVAISTFSATTGDFGCVRVTFCNQNLSVVIKILLVAISRRYHNAHFGSSQQGGVFPMENNALHVG